MMLPVEVLLSLVVAHFASNLAWLFTVFNCNYYISHICNMLQLFYIFICFSFSLTIGYYTISIKIYIYIISVLFQ